MRYILGVIFFVIASCNNQDTQKINTVAVTEQTPVNCDTTVIDQPPLKDYKKALDVWLETTSLDWFLDKRQSAWREAKAWHVKTMSVDSNNMLQCLSNRSDSIFLYIPHHFYNKEKTGTEYFQFFIVNNSADTILIPRIDATINNIGSSVAIAKKDTAQQWLLFQQTTGFVGCGNSYWTMKLPPKMAIQSQIESGYINLGDTTVDYRIELLLNKQKFVSNSIKINLMKKQLPYLGKNIE